MLVTSAQAQQVTSDGTLNTSVTRSGNNFTIDNGITSGNNLFHSFQEFSIPTGGSASFNNATNIETIFSRVTGGTVSNIDGILRANGTANLFLLNPNGILFGANARLEISGSFVGTTANLIRFQDGTEFQAAATSQPLLTMSAPIGLQFNGQAKNIQMQGNGHSLTAAHPIFAPTQRGSVRGLQVQSGKTLALVGGEIALTSSTLTAEQGRIELGSVESGFVKINPIAEGFAIDYSQVQAFRNLTLSDRALVDASGGGTIQLQGSHLSLRDGSVALIQNQGTQTAGRLIVASDSLDLKGGTPDGKVLSGLETQTLGLGQSGTIQVTTQQINILDGARILTRTFSNAPAGTITVNAARSLQTIGYVLTDPTLGSAILSTTLGSGNAGNVQISTTNLTTLNGGFIASSTFGQGTTGDVTIDAQDIQVIGMTPTFSPSSLNTISFGAGDARNITINTQRLSVLQGGQINASTSAAGNGGSVMIRATELIRVSDRLPGSPYPSFIASAAETASPLLQQALRLPPSPSGASGNLTLYTNQLEVTNQGRITVRNTGSGNAGSLTIQATAIALDTDGSITAETASGEGGNITLQAGNHLLMRRGSILSTKAENSGNGGNLTINAPVILGLENSDISANAVRGRGGNIQITTQGIIGLQYRDRSTPESDITASSEFGVNGSVQVNNIGVDPNAGLIELSEDLVDDNQQVAAGCVPNQSSSFVITGRGGVPQNPSDRTHARPWSDLRAFSPTAAISSVPAPDSLVEATAWQRNPQTGKVELVASQIRAASAIATCSGLTAHEPSE